MFHGYKYLKETGYILGESFRKKKDILHTPQVQKLTTFITSRSMINPFMVMDGHTILFNTSFENKISKIYNESCHGIMNSIHLIGSASVSFFFSEDEGTFNFELHNVLSKHTSVRWLERYNNDYLTPIFFPQSAYGLGSNMNMNARFRTYTISLPNTGISKHGDEVYSLAGMLYDSYELMMLNAINTREYARVGSFHIAFIEDMKAEEEGINLENVIIDGEDDEDDENKLIYNTLGEDIKSNTVMGIIPRENPMSEYERNIERQGLNGISEEGGKVRDVNVVTIKIDKGKKVSRIINAGKDDLKKYKTDFMNDICTFYGFSPEIIMGLEGNLTKEKRDSINHSLGMFSSLFNSFIKLYVSNYIALVGVDRFAEECVDEKYADLFLKICKGDKIVDTESGESVKTSTLGSVVLDVEDIEKDTQSFITQTDGIIDRHTGSVVTPKIPKILKDSELTVTHVSNYSMSQAGIGNQAGKKYSNFFVGIKDTLSPLYMKAVSSMTISSECKNMYRIEETLLGFSTGGNSIKDVHSMFKHDINTKSNNDHLAQTAGFVSYDKFLMWYNDTIGETKSEKGRNDAEIYLNNLVIDKVRGSLGVNTESFGAKTILGLMTGEEISTEGRSKRNRSIFATRTMNQLRGAKKRRLITKFNKEGKREHTSDTQDVFSNSTSEDKLYDVGDFDVDELEALKEAIMKIRNERKETENGEEEKI